MNILLVEPNFPIPTKSKNHKSFLPIGLMKIYSYHFSVGNKVQLVRGNLEKEEIFFDRIDQIWISSLFTYWFYCVEESVNHYRREFPKATILVGGIAASLFPEEAKKRLNADFIIEAKWGSTFHLKTKNKKQNKIIIVRGVEKFTEKTEDNPSYFACFSYISVLNAVYKDVAPKINFQIVHGQRGCLRKCKFCGVHIIEPKFEGRSGIEDVLVRKRNLVFYDNNFLAAKDNPTRVTKLLNELIKLKKERKIGWAESQSGFDGRILIKNPQYAKMMKQAGFRNIRIAWDGNFSQKDYIKKQIDVLTKNGGYKSKDIFVFMIYNWELSFEEMERKRKQCWRWKVQISDCRNRPLDLFERQYYNPRAVDQTTKDYYIHQNWIDAEIKQFRRNIRRQNISVRRELPFYSKACERKIINKRKTRKLNKLSVHKAEEFARKNNIDLWFPGRKSEPLSKNQLFEAHIKSR